MVTRRNLGAAGTFIKSIEHYAELSHLARPCRPILLTVTDAQNALLKKPAGFDEAGHPCGS